MKIKELSLANFGQHRSLQLKDIKGSVVGILGPNGSGKSTIEQAISFAFTGELPGKAESWIYVGESALSVRLVFEKDGTEGVIERKYTAKGASSRSFVWDGQEPVTAAKEVDAAIEGIIGADKNAVANTVFITQGDIANLVKATPAKRMELMVKLLNLSYLTKRVNALDGKIKQLSDSVMPIEPLKVQLMREQAELKDLEDRLAAALRQFSDKYPTKQELEELGAEFYSYENLRCNIKEAEDRLAEKNGRAAELLGRGSEMGVLASTLRELNMALEEHLVMLNQKRDAAKDLQLKTAQELSSLQDLSDSIAKYVQIKARIKSYNDALSDFAPIKTLEEVRLIMGLHEDLEETEKSLQYVSDSMANAKSNREKLLGQTRPRHETAAQAAKSALDILRPQLANYITALSHSKSLLSTRKVLREKFAAKSEEDTTCPICGLQLQLGQSVTDQSIGDLEREIGELETAKTKAEQAIADFEAKERDAQKSLAEIKFLLEQFQGTIDSAEKELGALTAHRDELLASLKKAAPTLTVLDPDWYRAHMDGYKNLVKLSASHDRDLEDAEFLENHIRKLNPNIDLKTEVCNDVSYWKNIQDDASKDLSGRLEAGKQEIAKLDDGIREADLLRQDITSHEAQLIAFAGALRTLNAKSEQHKFRTLYETYKTDPRVPTDNVGMLGEYVSAGLEYVKNSIQPMEYEISAKKKNIQELDAQIQELEDRNGKVYDAIEELDAIKALLSPKEGVTKSYLSYLFSAISENIAEYLGFMDSNFIIAPEDREGFDPLSFKFKRLDRDLDEWLPMTKLSGGEEIKLSIALILAVQQLVCPELNFLVLDEPSTHLDESSVGALAALLASLGRNLQAQSGQVWVVDHNKALETAFTETVVLG